MDDYKLPVLKSTLDILCEALTTYRKNGIKELPVDEQLVVNKEWRDKLSKAKDDPQKQLTILLGMPEDQLRAQEESFKKMAQDLDITIAKVQLLRKRLEGEEDSYIVDDLINEILK